MDRRTGARVWLLPEWTNHDGKSSARSEAKSQRRRNPRIDEQDVVPLHDVLPHSGCHQTGCEDNCRRPRGAREGGGRMTTFNGIPKQVEDILEKYSGGTSRRNFLKTSGLLVVSLTL